MITPPNHTPSSKSLSTVLQALESQEKFCNGLAVPVAEQKRKDKVDVSPGRMTKQD